MEKLAIGKAGVERVNNPDINKIDANKAEDSSIGTASADKVDNPNIGIVDIDKRPKHRIKKPTKSDKLQQY